MVTVEKKDLVLALEYTNIVAEKRNTMPILSSTLIKSGFKQDTKGIFLSSTDLENSVTKFIACEVTNKLAIAVPTSAVLKVLKTFPNNKLITISGSTFSCGKIKFEANALPASEYPELHKHEKYGTPNTADNWINSISKVEAAVSKEESRVNMHGVFFDGNKLIATDGRRLHKYQSNLDIKCDDDILVPICGLNKMLKVLKKSKSKTVYSSIDNRFIMFYFNDVSFAIRLIDEIFCDYEKAIPTEFKSKVIVNADELKEGLTRLATLDTERYKGFKFTYGSEGVAISSDNSNKLGTFSQEIELISSTGESGYIGLNAIYVLDYIKASNGSELIEFHLSGETSQVLLKSNDANFIGVVMPMRLTDIKTMKGAQA